MFRGLIAVSLLGVIFVKSDYDIVIASLTLAAIVVAWKAGNTLK